MDDYGHVDDETPSFAISFYKEYRGQGIGSQLGEDARTIEIARNTNGIILAVQKNELCREYV